MNLADITQVSVRDFAEELGKVEIKQVIIPVFLIPNWPKEVVLKGHLGRKDYCVPILDDNGLLTWKTGRHGISFRINEYGTITFSFHGFFGKPVFGTESAFDGYKKIHWASSNHIKNSSRLATLVLFDRFKVEILTKILSDLKVSVPVHNQVVDAVTKAFEPFIPFVVADQLSG